MSKLDDLYWWTADVASSNGILPVPLIKEPFKQRVKKLMLELIGPHESLTSEEIQAGRIYRVGDPQGDAVDRYKDELAKKVAEL